jgi:hypothetical protein
MATVGLTSMNQLSITSTAQGASIAFGGDTIVLQGITAGSVYRQLQPAMASQNALATYSDLHQCRATCTDGNTSAARSSIRQRGGDRCTKGVLHMGILDELLGGGQRQKSTGISLIDTNKETRPRATPIKRF